MPEFFLCEGFSLGHVIITTIIKKALSLSYFYYCIDQYDICSDSFVMDSWIHGKETILYQKGPSSWDSGLIKSASPVNSSNNSKLEKKVQIMLQGLLRY